MGQRRIEQLPFVQTLSTKASGVIGVPHAQMISSSLRLIS
jgi:hypothetical protein